MDRKIFVLDSPVLLLYFAGDRRVEQLVNRINDGIADGYMLEQCASELFGKLNERLGHGIATKRLEAIKNSRIRLLGTDFELMKDSAEIKSKHKGKLPMIGAYMIALAKNLGAVIVTSDENIAKTGEVRVEYIKARG
ncbi:MAG: PIN domain-containing protein [Nitrososphaerales archaeon]